MNQTSAWGQEQGNESSWSDSSTMWSKTKLRFVEEATPWIPWLIIIHKEELFQNYQSLMRLNLQVNEEEQSKWLASLAHNSISSTNQHPLILDYFLTYMKVSFLDWGTRYTNPRSQNHIANSSNNGAIFTMNCTPQNINRMRQGYGFRSDTYHLV